MASRKPIPFPSVRSHPTELSRAGRPSRTRAAGRVFQGSPMFEITVSDDLAGARHWARAVFPKESQAATLTAINECASFARLELRDEMSQVFDRPTPFTLRAVYVKRATPPDPVAEVWLIDQAVDRPNFLVPQVHGGNRAQKPFERRLSQEGFRVLPAGWVTVPGPGARFDGYGNMARGQIVQILSVLQALPWAGQAKGYTGAQTARSRKRNRKPRDYFASTPQNPARANGRDLAPGVYERKGRRIVQVLRFVPSAYYGKRLDLFGTVRNTFARRFNDRFERALRARLAQGGNTRALAAIEETNALAGA